MLVLKREVGESIMIGDNIIVKVLSTKGHQTRLGVEAPQEIVVHREEVYHRIRAKRQEEELNKEA